LAINHVCYGWQGNYWHQLEKQYTFVSAHTVRGIVRPTDESDVRLLEDSKWHHTVVLTSNANAHYDQDQHDIFGAPWGGRTGWGELRRIALLGATDFARVTEICERQRPSALVSAVRGRRLLGS
jgi:hypothetical protein